MKLVDFASAMGLIDVESTLSLTVPLFVTSRKDDGAVSVSSAVYLH